MSLSDDAAIVYKHLVKDVVPARRVTTYGEVSKATGVPMGLRGNHMTQVLYRLFLLCDAREIPPITAVVVKAGAAYDDDRHGAVGKGYLTAEAESANHARRHRSDAFKRQVEAGKRKFDEEAVVTEFRDMIEGHQDSVWDCKSWPAGIGGTE